MNGAADLPAGVRRARIEPLWDRVEHDRVKVAAFIAVFIVGAGLAAAAMAAALVGLGAFAELWRYDSPRWSR